MTKRILPLFALITLAACLLTYKFGSPPVALAKARPTPQDASELAAPLTLPTAPSTWTLVSSSGLGVLATVTKPAGGTGVKHVATCVTATFTVVSPGGSDLGGIVKLVDGTNVLLFWHLQAPVNGSTSTVNLCDLNVVGSPNTAMTLTFDGAYSYNVESVNLVGYEAQ